MHERFVTVEVNAQRANDDPMFTLRLR
uniref:Uncharacterized protein n=1 Tax=mine drainage metagenome TaxID=410659 RepID=E6PH28_9ZZZZ